MRILFRRFALAMTVILALTFLLVGSSLVAARAKQTLTGKAPDMLQWDVVSFFETNLQALTPPRI